MEAAPRPRQMSLSNWSVTRKVGIVLLLPVLLASIFAVLRINDGLAQIRKLNAATEQAKIIRPMLVFTSSSERLAITAASQRDAANPDPGLDKITTTFDQAAADLDTALRSTKADSKVTTELAAALSAARTMRGGLRTNSPATIGQQYDEVANHVSNAMAISPSAEENGIERTFLQLGTTMTARRLLLQEFMLTGTVETNPASRGQLFIALGGEMIMVNHYGQLQAETAINGDKLLQAVQMRIGAFSQPSIDANTLGQVANSLQSSLDAYIQADTHLVDTIDSRLNAQTTDARSSVLRDVAIVIGMLLAGLALALAVARSLVVPVRRLRRGALQVAHTDLPRELEVVRTGGETPEIAPIEVHTTEEIGQLARSVDDIHRVALDLAAEQARLRLQIGNMFETLSRRSQSLVEQQLSLIEELERDEDDSERLQSLFRLDHLATRMRRNGDNLLVLAGTALRRGYLPAVPLSDMLWSAVSQVEDYQRVEIGAVPDGVVAGEPAVDIEHLLAELIDNALRYSPPSTPVVVSVARAVDGGYLIEITDRGLGMSGEDLRGVNERLAAGGEVTLETARRMGLFVVGRLAKRHVITVGLRRTSTMAQQPGLTASVHLPGILVSPALDDTGPQPITSTFAPATPDPTVQPRVLAAVPDPTASRESDAESVTAESGRFSVTSSGLPQRRPGAATGLDTGRSGETPTPVARLALPEATDYADPAETDDPPADFGPPTDVWPRRSQPVEPVIEAPVDIWAEADPDTFGPPIRQEPPARPDAPPPGGRGVALAPPRPADLRPVNSESPTPIYQRMVSEWLVEPATAADAAAEDWTSEADAGWQAAAEASTPTSTGRTTGGLPIRRPGAQLVPGGLAPSNDSGAPDPEEIRSNLSRHLSGVRSGRADTQYNDGGHA
ncbi:HAMP domain-containing protein [Nocardia terpenica]